MLSTGWWSQEAETETQAGVESLFLFLELGSQQVEAGEGRLKQVEAGEGRWRQAEADEGRIRRHSGFRFGRELLGCKQGIWLHILATRTISNCEIKPPQTYSPSCLMRIQMLGCLDA